LLGHPHDTLDFNHSLKRIGPRKSSVLASFYTRSLSRSPDGKGCLWCCPGRLHRVTYSNWWDTVRVGILSGLPTRPIDSNLFVPSLPYCDRDQQYDLHRGRNDALNP